MFFWGYSTIISAIIGSLYIVSDKQNIIYRQKTRGNDVVYDDAKMLFVDIVKLFYKKLKNLQKKDKKKKKKKNNIINLNKIKNKSKINDRNEQK